MRRIWIAGLMQLALWTPLPALAADDCPSSYICASRPEGIVSTLQALGYKADATKVDAKKAPSWKAGNTCSNCMQYTGKAGAASGPCGAFGGKEVSAKGWCMAWVKKA